MGGYVPAGWWDSIQAWLDSNAMLVWWMCVVSVGSLVLAIVLLPIFVARLDADYFIASRRRSGPPRHLGGWLLWIGRNLIGLVFVLAGVVLLVLPGQGLLMIIIGLLLVDFPGKRAIERKIARRPKILKLLNGIRSRRGRPPLVVD